MKNQQKISGYILNSVLFWQNGVEAPFERVLWVRLDEVYCIGLTPDPGHGRQASWPFCRSGTELDLALATQEVCVLEDRPPCDPGTLPAATKHRWEKRWSAIEAIVGDLDNFFGGVVWQRAAVANAAKASGLSRGTIRTLLRKYWVGGQTPYCLLPDYRAKTGGIPDWIGRKITAQQRHDFVTTGTDPEKGKE